MEKKGAFLCDSPKELESKTSMRFGRNHTELRTELWVEAWEGFISSPSTLLRSILCSIWNDSDEILIPIKCASYQIATTAPCWASNLTDTSARAQIKMWMDRIGCFFFHKRNPPAGCCGVGLETWAPVLSKAIASSSTEFSYVTHGQRHFHTTQQEEFHQFVSLSSLSLPG